MCSVKDVQVKLLLTAALTDTLNGPESSVNFLQVFNGDRSSDEKDQIFYMVARAIEVRSNTRAIMGESSQRDVIILALCNTLLTSPKDIEALLDQFLKTLSRYASAWVDWASGPGRDDIQTMVARCI